MVVVMGVSMRVGFPFEIAGARVRSAGTHGNEKREEGEMRRILATRAEWGRGLLLQ